LLGAGEPGGSSRLLLLLRPGRRPRVKGLTLAAAEYWPAKRARCVRKPGACATSRRPTAAVQCSWLGVWGVTLLEAGPPGRADWS